MDEDATAGAAGPAGLPPAHIGFDHLGRPSSARFGDVYKSRERALDEAAHVFVAGSDLPGRLQAGRRFTLLEAGFGVGVNLFATWRCLREHGSGVRLDYVAIDAFPPSAQELSRAWRAYGLHGPLTDALLSGWPPRTRGRHRLRLPDGIVLTLVFDDIETALAGLDCTADAIYLDGFSPDRNPRMWGTPVARALARLSREHVTTVATYSAAGHVRAALAGAGFVVARRPGHADKRHCLHGRFDPQHRSRHPRPAPPLAADAAIAVVGGGIAGATIAATLAHRGRNVRWIVDPDGVDGSGSAQPALAAHPHLSPDDNVLARLSRAALAAASDTGPGNLRPPGLPEMARERMSRLILGRDPQDQARLHSIVARAGLPAEFARAVDAREAGARSGVPCRHGGLLLDALPVLRARGAPAVATAPDGAIAGRVAALHGETGGWRLENAGGVVLARAEVIILATGHPGAGLVDARIPARRVRGQSTAVRIPSLAGLRCVIGAESYVCPLADGRVLVGASYDERATLLPDPQDDEANLSRLSGLLGAAATGSRPDGAWVGHRYVAPDRLPCIGPVLDAAPVLADPDPWRRNDRLALPRTEGLYLASCFGSRGVLWASLAASLLSDHFDAAPGLVDSGLAAAIDPARFARRALRRGGGP